MKILFVLPYYHPYIGGAELAFKGLAEELVRRGHSARVITARLAGTPRHENINGVDVERVPVPRRGDRYFFSVLSLPLVLARAPACDLVHTASHNLAPPLLGLMRVVRRPVVFTCHEVIGARWPIIDPNLVRAWLYRLVERINVGMAYDRHVAVSRSTMTALLSVGVARKRIEVIYNGIDESFADRPEGDGGFRRALGIGPDEFLYLYFGRPGRPKGVHVLLRAVPAIQDRLPTSHLVLILAPEPAGPYAELMRVIERLGSGLNIHVHAPLPNREDLARCLVDADCIVIPSITEGFGLTTVEACSLGVPVVATRAGAIPEVISGRHILVGPASASALAGGVVRAWRQDFDPWKPAPSFSWGLMASAYEACYQELLASCA